MANKTWVEVALNGAWTRQLQPKIPVSAEEIIAEGVACAKAGAAIVHAHTLDPESGQQNSSLETGVAFIEGIRSQVEAIVYPTCVEIPLPADWQQRYTTMIGLAEQGLLEWGVIDPGSVNLAFADPAAPPIFGDDGIYANQNGALELGMQLAAKHGFHPAYACYEPGFVRNGAMLHAKYPLAPVPIYRVMLSTDLAFSFPAEEWALDAYAKHIAQMAPGAPWMLAGLAVDVVPLIPHVIELGGHVRVGLEDARFANPQSNLQLVEAAVDALQKAGSEPASAAEIRAELGTRG